MHTDRAERGIESSFGKARSKLFGVVSFGESLNVKTSSLVEYRNYKRKSSWYRKMLVLKLLDVPVYDNVIFSKMGFKVLCAAVFRKVIGYKLLVGASR